MQVVCPCRKNATDRHTDVDGPIRCSSLTLELEEHLKTEEGEEERSFVLSHSQIDY
jgi:hypothetical protein